MNIENPKKYYPRLRAKLIFNPVAGAPGESPAELMAVIQSMQDWNIVPEVFFIEPGCDLSGIVKEAMARGIRLFVACGGDGTISSLARLLEGTPATLGIIPSGTQNNTALSLNIPSDIPSAIAILREGRRIKVDVGLATCGETTTPFLEVCSVGLVSALFPSADDIQHGNIARVADFLSTLTASPPADIRLVLDNHLEIRDQGHVALVSNMPYIGLHYRFGEPAAFHDGLLDVMFFAALSKLELLGYVFQGVGVESKSEDPRIQRYHVRQVEIESQPAMPVMVDGIAIGEGRVRIEARRRVLAVMVAQPAPKTIPSIGESIEQRADSAAVA